MATIRTFSFSSHPEAVSAARRALEGLDDSLDHGLFYDASLCVSELVTIAVLNSGEGGEELRLEVSLDAGALRVSVASSAGGFAADPFAAEDDGGWGLVILERLSHRWGITREGENAIWFEMRLDSRPGEAFESDGTDMAAATP